MLRSIHSSDGVLVEGSGAGITEYLHYDDVDKVIGVERVQDVEPILNNTKELANEYNAGKNKAGDFYLAGRFPQVLIENWLMLRSLKMSDFKGKVIDDFLNDSDHSAFRVWQGRV